jgi:LysM repeat protein
MESLRQIGTGFLLGVLSVAIILGAFSLAMAEGGLLPTTPATETLIPPVPTLLPTLPGLPTNTPAGTISASPSPSSTASYTPPPPPTTCPPPAGWLPVVIQPDDTLDSLAQTYNTPVETLRSANCLYGDELVVGTFLYVPPLPTATRIPCGAPVGWINYIVKSGDTLYQISLLYRVSVPQLQQANCILTTNIRAGQVLKVPNVPTSTPWMTSPTTIPTLTSEPTLRPTGEAPTATPETPSPTTEIPSPTTQPTETIQPSNTPPPTEPVSAPPLTSEATAIP